MTKYEKENWIINLENVAAEVSSEYGSDVVQSILILHNATSIEDLSQSEYEAVFSDLYLIASDN